MKIKNDKIIIHIICLIVAIGLWLLVMIRENPTNDKIFYRVPVAIKNAESLKKGDIDYVMTEDKNSFTVNVKVTGLLNDLAKVEAKDIRANAILTNFNEGPNYLYVTVETINNMKAEVISSKYITCTIEQIVSVPVDISVKHIGAVAEGYYLKGGYSKPELIYVKGPRSTINSVSTARVVRDISDRKESISQYIPVVLLDNTDQEVDTSLLTLSQSSVEAIYEILPTKKVPIKVTTIGELGEDYRLTDSKVSIETITIAAPREILDSITELETDAVDITDVERNINTERKIIFPPEVISVDKIDRTNVTVTIEKVAEKEFVFDYKDIEYINKADDLIVVYENEGSIDVDGNENNENAEKQIIVKIKAVVSVLNRINKGNIKLTVDLTEAVEGVNDVLLNISTTIDVEEITSDVEYIKVNLEKAVVETEPDANGDGRH